jgi:hypothetical protein
MKAPLTSARNERGARSRRSLTQPILDDETEEYPLRPTNTAKVVTEPENSDAGSFGARCSLGRIFLESSAEKISTEAPPQQLG